MKGSSLSWCPETQWCSLQCGLQREEQFQCTLTAAPSYDQWSALCSWGRDGLIRCASQVTVTVIQTFCNLQLPSSVNNWHLHLKIQCGAVPCAECPSSYVAGRSLDHSLREHHRALKKRDLGSSALGWACVFLEPSSGSIGGHGDWHPQPHPDPLDARVLAHPAPPVPPQLGEGHFARTLCCTTDLTMLPSGVLSLLCCYYC